MSRPVRLGQVYRCPVCGAEVVVIRALSGALDLHCCNTAMEPLGAMPVYRCPVCGSEVTVLRGETEVELVCCNRPMVRQESPLVEAA